MESIQSALTAGFLGLIPAAVLFVIFVAWSKAALGAAAWIAKRGPAGAGDQKAPTASFDFLGMKVENIPVAILVHILPPIALYLGVVWFYLSAAETQLAAFGKSSSSIRLQTITGTLVYPGALPPETDRLLLRPGPWAIDFRETKDGEQTTPFVVENFPVNDNAPLSTRIQITHGCLESEEVSVSPGYYNKLQTDQKVTIDTNGVRQFLKPIFLKSHCSKIDRGPVPGGQTAKSIPDN